MTIVGISLILASVVYLAIRRPPLIETLRAIWRGYPRIEQPPSTRPPTDGSRSQEQIVVDEVEHDGQSSATAEAKDGTVMSPPPFPAGNGSAKQGSPGEPSPQTTPKASAAEPTETIPSFSLSSSPPKSAASIARTTDALMPPSILPSLSAPNSVANKPSAASSLMPPPPPRPPVLNNLNNSSLLSPAPSRLYPAPTRDRQSGSSTLAPPPTHSSKPAKPSRKVILTPGHSPLDWARLANGPSSDLRNLPAGTPYLRVTPSMLKRQTGRKGKDAWTALGGRVYNLTPYLPFHPGGEPELLRAVGRDGTKLFGEIHPWVNYEGMLASSLIGMLVEEHEGESSAMDDMD